MPPTEKPGQSQLATHARVTVELADPDIIEAEHDGKIFTDDVLITYTRLIDSIDGPDQRDGGWVVTARVQGHRVARRPNPDGSPKRLKSYGQRTFVQGTDVFPDWLSKITDQFNPENA
jgi:hypothetical protein